MAVTNFAQRRVLGDSVPPNTRPATGADSRSDTAHTFEMAGLQCVAASSFSCPVQAQPPQPPQPRRCLSLLIKIQPWGNSKSARLRSLLGFGASYQPPTSEQTGDTDHSAAPKQSGCSAKAVWLDDEDGTTVTGQVDLTRHPAAGADATQTRRGRRPRASPLQAAEVLVHGRSPRGSRGGDSDIGAGSDPDRDDGDLYDDDDGHCSGLADGSIDGADGMRRVQGTEEEDADGGGRDSGGRRLYGRAATDSDLSPRTLQAEVQVQVAVSGRQADDKTGRGAKGGPATAKPSPPPPGASSGSSNCSPDHTSTGASSRTAPGDPARPSGQAHPSNQSQGQGNGAGRQRSGPGQGQGPAREPLHPHWHTAPRRAAMTGPNARGWIPLQVTAVGPATGGGGAAGSAALSAAALAAAVLKASTAVSASNSLLPSGGTTASPSPFVSYLQQLAESASGHSGRSFGGNAGIAADSSDGQGPWPSSHASTFPMGQPGIGPDSGHTCYSGLAATAIPTHRLYGIAGSINSSGGGGGSSGSRASSTHSERMARGGAGTASATGLAPGECSSPQSAWERDRDEGGAAGVHRLGPITGPLRGSRMQGHVTAVANPAYYAAAAAAAASATAAAAMATVSNGGAPLPAPPAGLPSSSSSAVVVVPTGAASAQAPPTAVLLRDSSRRHRLLQAAASAAATAAAVAAATDSTHDMCAPPQPPEAPGGRTSPTAPPFAGGGGGGGGPASALRPSLAQQRDATATVANAQRLTSQHHSHSHPHLQASGGGASAATSPGGALGGGGGGGLPAPGSQGHVVASGLTGHAVALRPGSPFQPATSACVDKAQHLRLGQQAQQQQQLSLQHHPWGADGGGGSAGSGNSAGPSQAGPADPPAQPLASATGTWMSAASGGAAGGLKGSGPPGGHPGSGVTAAAGGPAAAQPSSSQRQLLSSYLHPPTHQQGSARAAASAGATRQRRPSLTEFGSVRASLLRTTEGWGSSGSGISGGGEPLVARARTPGPPGSQLDGFPVRASSPSLNGTLAAAALATWDASGGSGSGSGGAGDAGCASGGGGGSSSGTSPNYNQHLQQLAAEMLAAGCGGNGGASQTRPGSSARPAAGGVGVSSSGVTGSSSGGVTQAVASTAVAGSASPAYGTSWLNNGVSLLRALASGGDGPQPHVAAQSGGSSPHPHQYPHPHHPHHHHSPASQKQQTPQPAHPAPQRRAGNHRAGRSGPLAASAPGVGVAASFGGPPFLSLLAAGGGPGGGGGAGRGAPSAQHAHRGLGRGVRAAH